MAVTPSTQDHIGGNNIDSMRQLNQINSQIIKQLDRCNLLFLREEEKVKEFNALSERIEKDPDDVDTKIKLEKLWDSHLKSTLSIQNNVISISGEVRKQIELQLKIAESLYNIQMMAEFQNEVIEIIKQVDPIVAQRLITKLKERRTIRGLMKINTI